MSGKKSIVVNFKPTLTASSREEGTYEVPLSEIVKLDTHEAGLTKLAEHLIEKIFWDVEPEYKIGSGVKLGLNGYVYVERIQFDYQNNRILVFLTTNVILNRDSLADILALFTNIHGTILVPYPYRFTAEIEDAGDIYSYDSNKNVLKPIGIIPAYL